MNAKPKTAYVLFGEEPKMRVQLSAERPGFCLPIERALKRLRRYLAIVGAVLLTAQGAWAQNLFVTGTDNITHSIYEFTPGGSGSTFATISDGPQGIAFNSNGDMYVADGQSNIYKFAPDGTRTTFASGLSSTNDLAFDGAGYLYESDFGSGNIYRFASDGTRTTFASGLFNTPPPDGARGLVFDSLGNLYLGYGGSILKFTSGGNQSTFATGLDFAVGLACDASDNIYAANYHTGVISKFTPGGFGSVFASGFNSPNGLAFDSAGNLFVGDGGNNRIIEIDPGGSESTFASNVAGANYLAFRPRTSTPEPFTLCLGLAGIGVFLRRKLKTKGPSAE